MLSTYGGTPAVLRSGVLAYVFCVGPFGWTVAVGRPVQGASVLPSRWWRFRTGGRRLECGAVLYNSGGEAILSLLAIRAADGLRLGAACAAWRPDDAAARDAVTAALAPSAPHLATRLLSSLALAHNTMRMGGLIPEPPGDSAPDLAPWDAAEWESDGLSDSPEPQD